MTKRITPVKLKLMEECPRCFWLETVDSIKRPKDSFPSAPAGLRWQMARHFDRYRKREELPPELKELEERGFSLYREEELLKPWRTPSKGIQFTDEVSDVLISASLDDVVLDIEGRMIPTKYRARGFPLKKPDSQIEHTQIYMDMYNYLLRENGYPTDDYGFLLVFYPVNLSKGGNSMRLKSELVVVDSMPSRAMDLIERAKEIINLKNAPASDPNCKYCQYSLDRNSVLLS